MAADLYAPSGDQRPHAGGWLRGTWQGSDVDEPVCWLVDTGSEMWVVRYSVGDKFEWTTPAVGQFAYGTNGAVAAAVYHGSMVCVSTSDPLQPLNSSIGWGSNPTTNPVI